MNIQEIALRAGVSPATVSRVFNNQSGIGPAIRERVLSVARAAHYHPRISGKQRNIVILLPYDAVYPVQSCVDMLLMALTQTLPARGFRLEILPVNNVERLDCIPFCGAIAIGVDATAFVGWERRFAMPLVILDRDSEKTPPGVFFVRSDEEQGMKLALTRLQERGCRRIGCIIHGEAGLGNASVRRAAIVKTLRELRLPCLDTLIYFSGTGTERYVEQIGKLLRNGVDALFCPGGNAGIMAAYAFSLFGKRVPEDVSLIASEQTFFSAYAVPAQSTICPNYAALAAAAGEVIEALIAGRTPPSRTVLPYELIERESVRSPAL